MKFNEFSKKWAGNSVANLFGGGTKAIYDFIVPGIVARALSVDDFSQWNLLLQIVAYVYLFGMGVQTAVAKFTSESQFHRDHNYRQRVFSAALVVVLVLFSVSLICVFLLTYAYPLIFHEITEAQKSNFRSAIFLIGISSCVQILTLLPVGIFMGGNQNYAFVFPQAFSRMLALLALWVYCKPGVELYFVAELYAIGLLLSAPIIFVLAYINYPWARLEYWVWASKFEIMRFARYCGSMSIWMISSLMVSSVSIVIVGLYDFRMSSQFAIGITASTIIGGLLNSVISPLIPIVSKMASEKAVGIHYLLKRMTQCTVVLLFFLLLLFILFGKAILGFWVGSDYAASSYLIVSILFFSNIVRFSLFPYCTFLMATAQHGRAVYAGLGEGITNVFFSIVLARFMGYGAVGVAFGTVIGGLVGVVIHYFLNFDSSPDLVSNRYEFIMESIIKPSFIIAPVVMVVLYVSV